MLAVVAEILVALKLLEVVILPLVLITVEPAMVPALIAEPETLPAVDKVGISASTKLLFLNGQRRNQIGV